MFPSVTPSIIDIKDKQYTSHDSSRPACHKCVAESDWDLCMQLPDCCICISGQPHYVYWQEVTA